MPSPIFFVIFALLNSYTTGLKTSEINELLANYWGIMDRQSAAETLIELARGNYVQAFPVVFKALNENITDYSKYIEDNVSKYNLDLSIRMQ